MFTKKDECECEFDSNNHSNLELQVCKSNAGYYFGRICPNCGPYSRDSVYYTSEAEAEDELKSYKQYYEKKMMKIKIKQLLTNTQDYYDFDGDEHSLMRSLHNFQFLMVENTNGKQIINRDCIRLIDIPTNGIPSDFIIDGWTVEQFHELFSKYENLTLTIDLIFDTLGSEAANELINKYNIPTGIKWNEIINRLTYTQLNQLVTDDDFISIVKIYFNL